MPEEFYQFSDVTYERLDAAGITPMSVLDVLHGGGFRVRRHLGAALQIAGQDRTGAWIGVALIERGGDDHYIVTGARRLDNNEINAITRMKGDQP